MSYWFFFQFGAAFKLVRTRPMSSMFGSSEGISDWERSRRLALVNALMISQSAANDAHDAACRAIHAFCQIRYARRARGLAAWAAMGASLFAQQCVFHAIETYVSKFHFLRYDNDPRQPKGLALLTLDEEALLREQFASESDAIRAHICAGKLPTCPFTLVPMDDCTAIPRVVVWSNSLRCVVPPGHLPAVDQIMPERMEHTSEHTSD